MMTQLLKGICNLKKLMKRFVRCINSFVLPESGASPWQKTYTAKTTSELMEAYREWAPTYDHDSIGRFGYAAPLATAQIVAKHSIRKDSIWLDAGAGTGQVGEHLSNLGFTNIIAADLSDDMLEIARQKEVYRSLHKVDLTDVNAFPPQSVNGIACVGTFTPNHLVEGSILENWLQWLKPGGFVVLSLREDFWEAPVPNGQNIQEISKLLPWTLLDTTEPQLYTPLVDDRIFFRVRVWRI